MQAYQSTNAHASVMDASPHKLIALILNRVLERISRAKLAVEQGDAAARGQAISKSIEAVASLQSWLDMEKGGEVADNLNGLYDYIVRRLLEANTTNDLSALERWRGCWLKLSWAGTALLRVLLANGSCYEHPRY
jgi:flagellar protein FliS